MSVTLYDRIGAGYDTTRRADPGIVGQLLELLALPAGSRCLDVACGTGNYTRALAGAGLQMTGLDISATMLAAARDKSDAARRVDWVRGDAAALPFADGTFAATVCTLALHHLPQPARAFREIARVMSGQPQGSRLVCFTADPAQMRQYWLTEYFPEALALAADQMADVETTAKRLEAAGFARVARCSWSVTPDLQDFFLYAGKYRPELYLDPRVRAGISTFASLADPAEVERGCLRLAADLASGRFAEVLRASEHPDGDYLFLVAELPGRPTDY